MPITKASRNKPLLMNAWRNRFNGNEDQLIYIQQLQESLRSRRISPEIDMPTPKTANEETRLFCRALANDASNAILENTGSQAKKITLFFLTLNLRRTKRQKTNQKLNLLLEKELAGTPLSSDISTVFLGENGYTPTDIAAITPRIAHKLVLQAAKNIHGNQQDSKTRNLLDQVVQLSGQKPRLAAIHLGIRVSPYIAGDDDYYDRLDPLDHIHSVHGTNQPDEARRLTTWRDKLSMRLKEQGYDGLFSWPCSRDASIELSITSDFTWVMSQEQRANDILATNPSAIHISTDKAAVNVVAVQNNRTAGPIRFDATLLGWPIEKTISEISGSNSVTQHQGDSTFKEKTDKIPRH